LHDHLDAGAPGRHKKCARNEIIFLNMLSTSKLIFSL
jgi:hypothetical protein